MTVSHPPHDFTRRRRLRRMDLSAVDRGSLVSNLFITISGPPGCGGTTLTEALARALDCGYVSGGDIFREVADERGMGLSQLTAKAEESDEIDRGSSTTRASLLADRLRAEAHHLAGPIG